MTVRQIRMAATSTYGHFRVTEYLSSWASVVAATSGFLTSGGTTAGYGYYAPPPNPAWQCCRVVFELPTGVIPSGATISAATIRYPGGASSSADAKWLNYILSSTHSSPIVADDYNNLGSTPWSDGFYAGETAIATLNATGISNISKGSGVSKFGVRAAADLDNTDPQPDAVNFGGTATVIRTGNATRDTVTNITYHSATLNGVAGYSNGKPNLIVVYTGGTETSTIYPRYRYKWWNTTAGEGTALYSAYQSDSLPTAALTGYNLSGLVPSTQYSYKIAIDDYNGETLTTAGSFITSALPVHGGFAQII